MGRRAIGIGERPGEVSEDMPLLLAFGSALAELRSERGLSQTALARDAGLWQPAVSMFENGLRDVPLSALARLAHALGMTPAQLLAATLEDAR